MSVSTLETVYTQNSVSYSGMGGAVIMTPVYIPHLITYRIHCKSRESLEILDETETPIVWEHHPIGPGPVVTSSLLCRGDTYSIRKSGGSPSLIHISLERY